jgi:hypothetical protein
MSRSKEEGDFRNRSSAAAELVSAVTQVALPRQASVQQPRHSRLVIDDQDVPVADAPLPGGVGADIAGAGLVEGCRQIGAWFYAGGEMQKIVNAAEVCSG